MFSQSSQRKRANWKRTAPHIALWRTERICSIVLTYSTKYIWQAFYKFNVFRWVWTMMKMRWCTVQKKRIRPASKPKRIQLFALIINCTLITEINPHCSRNVYAISDRIWCCKHLRHTPTENNIITMGKVDTSVLMMIKTWAIDIFFQSPNLKWASWTHTTPTYCNENQRLSIG